VIRRLAENHRGIASRLLRRSPNYNLYQLGNMEQLGFDTEFCEFWGDFAGDRSDCLRGILNRYMTGWSVYGLPETDWPGMAEIVDKHPVVAARLQDNPEGTESFLPYLTTYCAERILEEEMMALEDRDFRPAITPPGYTVRRASQRDLTQLVSFYSDAGSMTRSHAAVERPLRDTRVWIVERRRTLVSAALTNAELDRMAMIGGVFTKPAWRGQGLGPAVCSALCSELLREGKQPVLYWDTPAAGSIYRKLGFHEIGYWRSVWLQRC
jgi:uncharacterized protein